MSVVDLYIARFPPEAQRRLMCIRAAARKAFPDAEEKTCHSLPAFSREGRVFMFYGAYKAHISICVGYDWVDFLKVQYPQFQYTKATILFPHGEPFPEDVVGVICGLLGQNMGA